MDHRFKDLAKTIYFRKAINPLSFLLLAWALFITATRAIRSPNDFAEALWLLDYRFGFIKRGLIGSLISILNQFGFELKNERAIAEFSFIIFFVFCLILMAISWCILKKASWGKDAFLVLAVFLTSPFIVMSAHLVGYFDNIIILTTIGSILLILRGYPWYAGFLTGIAVLIHESVILIGVPLLVLTIYIYCP
jgi:hypothetical protein